MACQAGPFVVQGLRQALVCDTGRGRVASVAWEDQGIHLAQIHGEEGREPFRLAKGVRQVGTLHTTSCWRWSPPSPWLWGLPKDMVKEVEKLFRVLQPKCISLRIFSLGLGFLTGGWGRGRHLRALEDRQPMPRKLCKLTLYVTFWTFFEWKKLHLDV